jgi:hypothetical protein
MVVPLEGPAVAPCPAHVPATLNICRLPGAFASPKRSQAQFFSQVLERDRRFCLGELLQERHELGVIF